MGVGTLAVSHVQFVLGVTDTACLINFFFLSIRLLLII